MTSMTAPALGAGEKVLVTADAVHKKVTGTVWFTSRRALWRAADGKASVQRVEVPWASVKNFQCSPASESRAMIRLLRVSEGDPPVILRFLGSPADTPREVLERSQTAIRKAMKGEAEASTSSGSGAGSGGGSAMSGSSNSKAKADGKGTKDGGAAAKKMKWKTRGGLFGTASGGQSLRHSRDSMPGGRMRDVQDARQRAALLAGDDVLTAQYREMVDGGVVTEEEFWESRRRTLAEEDAKAAARHTGTPSDMPSDLVAETTSAGTLKFKLNARTIHSIFTMYPIVFKAYQANVPTEMTEKEFWTKYVQSAYFNRDRGSEGGVSGKGPASGNKRKAAEMSGATDDMFLRFAAQEAEREKKEKEQLGGAERGAGGTGRLEAGSVDPMVDLTSQWGDYHAREVDDSDPVEELSEAAGKRKEVVGKFNRHARLVMQPPDGGGSSVRRPALVDNAASATDLPELRVQNKDMREKLEIANRGRYRGGGEKSDATLQSRPQSPRLVEGMTLAEARASLGGEFSVLAERPNVPRAVPGPDRALAALKDCTEETDKGVGSAANLQGYPEQFISGIHRHFQIVGELLRHFYASLDRPKSDTAAAAKLDRLKTRMEDKLQQLTQERRALPRDATGNRLSAVIKPLMDCLDHAFGKLEESRSRGHGGFRKPAVTKGGWTVVGEDDDEDEDDDDDDEEERNMRGGWSVVR